MAETAQYLSQLYFEVDGSDLSEELTDSLSLMTVETSLHMPALATLTIEDGSLNWVDDERLAPGAPIKIAIDAGSGAEPLFDGEIVEIEPEFQPGAMQLNVRALDRLHRLVCGRQARTFQNSTDGDLVRKLAAEVGLKAETAETPVVYEHVFQFEESNLEFLTRRADRHGYVLFARGETLVLAPLGSDGSPVDLEWGVNLASFRARFSTLDQVGEVSVRGWDPMARQEIVGAASEGVSRPEVGLEQEYQRAMASWNGESKTHLVRTAPIRSQGEAEQVAQAVANAISGELVQAEGVCAGDPEISAGCIVSVSAVGDRFSGSYFVTSARHIYGPAEGYTTEFTVSAHKPLTVLETLSNTSASTLPGLMVGIVTDNLDPEELGRVKVRFPSLSDRNASAWARLAAAGGGKNRGIQFIPEINDEVLVGFEHGDLNHPYVLGGLWNGVDAPPEAGRDAISSGVVERRILRSRSGHEIVFDDSSNQGGILITDRSGNRIQINSVSNSMEVEINGSVSLRAGGSIALESNGQLSLRGAAGVSIESPGPVEISGAVLRLN